MKKLFSLLLAITLLVAFYPSSANAAENDSTIEYLEDGSYFITVIENEPAEGTLPMAKNTVTKSKTTYFKNKSGTTLWYVRVKGTFTYGNGTAKCTSATPSAESKSSAWKVSSATGSKSGNKASATATGKQYAGGIVVDTKTKTVTLTCSPDGKFS